LNLDGNNNSSNNFKANNNNIEDIIKIVFIIRKETSKASVFSNPVKCPVGTLAGGKILLG
jgi:hypothetical protein